MFGDSAEVLPPRWKSDAKEFEVKINYHETRGDLIFLPKPISELLGKPDTVKFIIKNKRIRISNK